MSTLLKILDVDGSPFHGGTGKWHLPVGKRPGKWMPKIDGIAPCVRGYHVVSVGQAFHWLGPVIFEVEVRGARIDLDDKSVVAQARLVRRLPWDERTARLFAADCAERVLPIFEAAQPGDPRPRVAVETARLFAVGMASDAEMAAAWAAAGDAAWDAARDAAWDAARAAARAAGAAAWAAARDAAARAAGAAGAAGDPESGWQAKRLAEVLGVEL